MWILLVIALILTYFYLTLCVPVAGLKREWMVSNKYPNKKEAALFLEKIHDDMIKFMRHLKLKYEVDRYDGDWSEYNRKQKMVKSLITNYNPDKLIENDPSVSVDTAYTINKGEALYFCVRQRGNPLEFNSYNSAMFAMLHELTHIACYDIVGHPPEFWDNFRWILKEAWDSGIYTPVDYSKFPQVYCGLKLTHNPLYD